MPHYDTNIDLWYASDAALEGLENYLRSRGVTPSDDTFMVIQDLINDTLSRTEFVEVN